ncbi:MAG TPA: hypothetical protein VF017_23630 [Thermoanaerobaculia bacterium]|nr:hypothetical protein [Thermoanaerobaculia bacterium]
MKPVGEILLDLLPWGLAVGFAGLLDRLRAYEPRPVALSDNLSWGVVAAPGVIQNRDGALSTTWRYQGIDTRVASAEELTGLSRALNRTIVRLGAGTMLHAEAVRRPVAPLPPGPHFPHPLAFLFDAERWQLHRREPYFETAFYLTLTVAPPARAEQRLRRTFLTTTEPEARAAEDHLERFAERCATFEHHLGLILRLERLGTSEQLRHLHLCLTGLDHPVAEPAAGVLLPGILCDQELVGGWRPRIGEHHLRVVRVNAYPTAATQPAFLDPLADLPAAYRWSTRVMAVPPEEADARVKHLQWMWYARRQDARSRLRRAVTQAPPVPDPDEQEIFEDRAARGMAKDSAALLERLHGRDEVLCAYTTKVVILDPDAARATDTATLAIQALTRKGFGAALETVNTLDAWLGSLPGHGSADLRRDPIPSANVADLLPVTGSWPGLATIPSPYFPPASPPLLWARSEGATPFRFNLHHGDVFHGLILGPTGAGKSYLTAHLALQFLRYPGAQVFVFDKGYSHYLPCRAVGGAHYDIGSPAGASSPFQPLREVHLEPERAWALAWLDRLLALQGLATTGEQRNAMARALELVASFPEEERTLDAFRSQVPDASLQVHLAPYCEKGPLAPLFTGTSDPIEDRHYLCFELGHILEADARAVVPVQLYLAHALAKRRTSARPTLLIWDEAWRALEDPFCRSWIKNDLATARKQNCGVVLITQSLAQINEPDLRVLIDEAAQAKVFLPNPGAAKPATRKLYEALGLSERHCELLASLTPKQEYLFCSRDGVRVFQLGRTELATALLTPPAGRTEEAHVAHLRGLAAEHPEDWLFELLEERSGAEWAARLRALTGQSPETWPAFLSETFFKETDR